MLKRYRTWLWTAVVFQFLTAVLHALSLFAESQPSNDTERQLTDLMANYKIDAGAGFFPTTANLFTALSSCFSFVCLLGGLTLAYLMVKKAELKLMKGVIGINLLIFTGVFAVMAAFTFLPPIVCTGLIALNLLVAYVMCPRIEAAV